MKPMDKSPEDSEGRKSATEGNPIVPLPPFSPMPFSLDPAAVAAASLIHRSAKQAEKRERRQRAARSSGRRRP